MITKTEMNIFKRVLKNQKTQLGHGNQHRGAVAINTGAYELDGLQASVRDSVISDLERNSIGCGKGEPHCSALLRETLESARA